jgi:hypothetical protein
MESVQRESLLLQHHAILGSECMRFHPDTGEKGNQILYPKVRGGWASFDILHIPKYNFNV